jgi:cobaltochelatase CobS
MGGGKSTALKQVADALGLEFGYIGQTLMPHDVVGHVHPVTSEYHGTAFTRIFEHGGLIAFEELDGWSANATLVLNPALTNGYLTLPDGRMIQRHPDCVIVACTNTWGTGPTAQYVGRNKLDDAFLDRFGAKIEWRYDADLERAAAGDNDVVDIVQTARMNAKKAGVRVAISPRASIDIAKMVAAGFTKREAINMNFGAELDADQRRIVLDGCDV